MSHHFDTDQAKNDSRLNLCDMYLFEAGPRRTALMMTVNADAGLSSPYALHPEGIYTFRFDTDGDARENLALKVRFGEPRQAEGSEYRHIQDYRIFLSREAKGALAGDLLIEGRRDTPPRLVPSRPSLD